LERRDRIEAKSAKRSKSLLFPGGRFPFAKSLNRQIVNEKMDPYAKPNEKKVGAKRPKISHLPSALETRTRQQRQAEKQGVAAERRAIKKSARRHLKKDLLAALDETD
jgi:hypothetical protein